jgi:signal peptidase I
MEMSDLTEQNEPKADGTSEENVPVADTAAHVDAPNSPEEESRRVAEDPDPEHLMKETVGNAESTSGTEEVSPTRVKTPPVASGAATDSGSKAPPEGESWIETVKTVAYALLIALVIRTFLFQPFNIPSGSMENTLLVGDYLFVEKFAYGYSRYSFPFGFPPFQGRVLAAQPQRGDVIVFKMPNANSPDYMKDFIKRVIGLPGDRVQMINGQVWLNDKAIPKVRVADYIETDEFGVENNVKRYRETLPGGKSYFVLDRRENGEGDNTQVYVVPPGHYFMMGDNRDNSADSRLEVGGFGFVPAQDLEGKAELIFFSTNGDAQVWEFWKWPWTVRYNRLFTVID